jgi:hypothetical protein
VTRRSTRQVGALKRVGVVSYYVVLREDWVQGKRRGNSHNNIIATTIKIIKTWWYPRKGR